MLGKDNAVARPRDIFTPFFYLTSLEVLFMTMFRMQDGTFIDAPTYRDARDQYDAAIRVLQAPVPPVPAPVLLAPATIRVIATPRDNFAGRDNSDIKRVGVGEIVNLGFVTNPLGQTAASSGLSHRGLVCSIKWGAQVRLPSLVVVLLGISGLNCTPQQE
jgi:hypothetical protein